MAGGLWARYFSRNQSCHGMALRRGAWIAGTKTRQRCSARCRRSCWGTRFPLGSSSLQFLWPELACRIRHSENCRCRHPLCVRIVSSFSVASSELGGDASRFWRFDALVFHNGVSARRRIDARPVISAIADCGKPHITMRLTKCTRGPSRILARHLCWSRRS